MESKNEENTEVKIDQIKDAVVKFKDDLGVMVKDLQLDVENWRFSVESQKDETKVDVAFTLSIKKKEEQKE